VLETEHIFLRDPETFGGEGWARAGRGRVGGSEDGAGGRCARGRGHILRDLDFAGPGDDRVVPGDVVRREVGEGVEEGGLSPARSEFLRRRGRGGVSTVVTSREGKKKIKK